MPEVHPTAPQRVCYECSSDAGFQPSFTQEETANFTRANTARRPALIQGLAAPVPPNFELSRVLGTLRVRIVEARGLIASDTNMLGKLTSSDPYIVLRISDGPSVKTRTLAKTLEPRWDEKVSFLISRCDPVLYVSAFDEDTFDADDSLGSLELPLGALHPSGTPFSGWFKLTPPEGNPGPAGSVFLELQLTDVDSNKHLMSYLNPPEPVPTPPAPFDIDAIYAPGMHIKDLLWDRFFYHVLCKTVELVFWTSPKTSAFALVAWNISTSYLKHWPAGSLLALVCYMFKQRNNSVVQSSGTASVESSKPEEAHLNSAIRSVLWIPAQYKDLCVFLAPLMRLGADFLQKIRDVMTWEHPSSPHVAAALVVAAMMCEVFKFSTVLKVLGSSTLLACSPVQKAALGLVAYLKWNLGDEKMAPACWEMRASFDESSLSSTAAAATLAAGRQWKANAAKEAARHATTLAAVAEASAAVNQTTAASPSF